MRLSALLLAVASVSFVAAQNATAVDESSASTTTDYGSASTTTDYESDPTVTTAVIDPSDDLPVYPTSQDPAVVQDLSQDNGFAAFRFANLISGDTDCLKAYWSASKDSAQQCADDPNAEPTAASNDTATAGFLGACLCAQVPVTGVSPPRTIDFDTYVQCCENIGRTGVRDGFTAACQNGDLTITTPVRGTSSPVVESVAEATASVEVTTGLAAPGFSVAPVMGLLTLAFTVGAALL